MAHEDIIARRYARGLAEYARDESRMDEVRRDVKRLADILDPRSGETHVPEFLAFLQSPVETPADKLAATEGVLGKLGIGDGVARFVKVLLAHNRIDMLPRISRAFSEVAGEISGEYTAVVHTARRLAADQEARLGKALSAAFGCAVHIHQQVEPGLLAGARVTVGDKTFDGTVLGRLNDLRHRLAARGQADLELLETERADESVPARSGK